MGIKIEHLVKRFGSFAALDDVSLDIRKGELLALLGPSGSGKTTLLRVIAGLEQADSGRVLFDGEDATRLTVQARRAGFVFQHYALFRHLTVEENIAFGLRVRKGRDRVPDATIRTRVAELLSLVQLEGFGTRYPAQLSGGQRQRVALARALAIEPRVLLLDEPFGALDAQVRRDLRRWLRELHDRTGLTTIFVTHDQEEALELADRVAILNRGRIEQLGSPADAYDMPASPFVYSFVGAVNRVPAQWDGGALHVAGLPLRSRGQAGRGRRRSTCVLRISTWWMRPILKRGRQRSSVPSAPGPVCVYAHVSPAVRSSWMSSCRPSARDPPPRRGRRSAWHQNGSAGFPATVQRHQRDAT